MGGTPSFFAREPQSDSPEWGIQELPGNGLIRYYYVAQKDLDLCIFLRGNHWQIVVDRRSQYASVKKCRWSNIDGLTINKFLLEPSFLAWGKVLTKKTWLFEVFGIRLGSRFHYSQVRIFVISRDWRDFVGTKSSLRHSQAWKQRLSDYPVVCFINSWILVGSFLIRSWVQNFTSDQQE